MKRSLSYVQATGHPDLQADAAAGTAAAVAEAQAVPPAHAHAPLFRRSTSYSATKAPELVVSFQEKREAMLKAATLKQSLYTLYHPEGSQVGEAMRKGAALSLSPQEMTQLQRIKLRDFQGLPVDHKGQRMMRELSELFILHEEVDSEQHVMSLVLCERKYKGNMLQGLTSAEAQRRLMKYGRNQLTEKDHPNLLVLWLSHVFGGFSMVMWFCAILTYIIFALDPTTMSSLYLGLFITFCVVVTGTFAFSVEYKSHQLLASFRELFQPTCIVERDGGRRMEIPVTDVVVGDSVVLDKDTTVPADIRLFQAENLFVDTSQFTGESNPVPKGVTAGADEDALHASNLCFGSSFVTNGEAKGICIATGDKSQIGRLARSVRSTQTAKTPLTMEIERFIIIIILSTVFLAALFLVIALVKGHFSLQTQDMVNIIGVVVANVPEGLTATVTLILTYAGMRMQASSGLIKKLASVETLGSCSVICSDKTGTMTKNEMTVLHVYVNGIIYPVSSSISLSPPSSSSSSSSSSLSSSSLPLVPPLLPPSPAEAGAWDATQIKCHQLLRIGALASNASFKADNTNDVDGDATEEGILRFVEATLSAEANKEGFGSTYTSAVLRPLGLSHFTAMHESDKLPTHMVDRLRRRESKVFDRPFNSVDKFAYSIHTTRQEGASRALLVMKGACDRIVNLCTFTELAGQVLPMTDAHRLAAEQAMDALACKGERVIGCCYREIDERSLDEVMAAADAGPSKSTPPPQAPELLHDLVFSGFFALTDPPRESVPAAIAQCQSAGIQVVMVTGDYTPTAKSIAQSVGVIPNGVEDIADVAKRRHISTKEFVQSRQKRPCKKCTTAENAAAAASATLCSTCAREVIAKWKVGETAEDAMTRENKLYADTWDATIISGDTLPLFDDEEWAYVLQEHKYIVFARTSPAQKHDIVSHFQHMGHIVAVTGDGINDAPALKKGDIGIAMNSGNQLSKDTALMILTDDDFSSIVKGIKEGRLVFDNLKKSIVFTLEHLLPEIIPIAAAFLLDLPTPFSPLLIVAVDLGTDLAPAVGLAFEPAETDIMQRPPRKATADRMVNSITYFSAYMQVGLIESVGVMFAYFMVMWDKGIPAKTLLQHGATFLSPDTEQNSISVWNGLDQAQRQQVLIEAQTAVFVALCLQQAVAAFARKTRYLSIFRNGLFSVFDNLVLNIAAVISLAFAAFVVYTPYVQTFFGSTSIPGVYWVYALPFAITILVWEEVRKSLLRVYGPDSCIYRYTYY